jgi:hypothetical protein
MALGRILNSAGTGPLANLIMTMASDDPGEGWQGSGSWMKSGGAEQFSQRTWILPSLNTLPTSFSASIKVFTAIPAELNTRPVTTKRKIGSSVTLGLPIAGREITSRRLPTVPILSNLFMASPRPRDDVMIGSGDEEPQFAGDLLIIERTYLDNLLLTKGLD